MTLSKFLLANRKKIGCLLYFVVSTPLALFSIMQAYVGRCSSAGCTPLLSFLFMFPGLLLAVIGGWWMIWRWLLAEEPTNVGDED